jgi:DNA polymerase-1
LRHFLFIDFLNICYRSFYAIPEMRSSKGVPTGAFYGFIKILKKVIEKQKITDVLICHDSSTSIRKKNNPTYKSKRDSTPLELEIQKNMLFEFFAKEHIPVISFEGHEADDIVYSMVQFCSKQEKGLAFILSSDKDLHRLLLKKNTFIIDLNKESILDKSWVEKQYGTEITEEKIALFYALCGDASDNVEGVRGIGEKTAKKIIEQYQSIDEAYNDNFNKVTLSPRLKTLLLENKENAYNALYLVNPFFIEPAYLTTYFETPLTKKSVFSISNGSDIIEKYECHSLLPKEVKKETTIVEEEIIPYAKSLYEPIACVTTEQIEKIRTEIEMHDIVAIDTETDSGDPTKANMIGFSISTSKEQAWYIPIVLHGTRHQLYEEMLGILHLIIELNKNVIMHNALFDLHVIQKTIGICPQNVCDTMIMAHVLRETKIGLKDLSARILKQKMQSFSEIMAFDKYKTFDEVELSTAASYAATDARQTLLLFFHYQTLLEQENFHSYKKLFEEIEMPVIPVLQSIEHAGILCDKEILFKQEEVYKKKMIELKKEIDSLTLPYGVELNPGSYKQTAFFLFDVLKIPTQKKFRTDQKTLSYLAGEYKIIDLILKYRSTQSNIAHFTTGLLRYIKDNGRVYTHYQQFITATGRITTINPNLQNIPRTSEGIFIRQAFHAAPGNLLISFDYSQIELRIVAYLANDLILLHLFNQNEDVHLLTATVIFEKSRENITKEERQIAKKINFSIIYGQSAFSLSKELKITGTQAREYIEKYKAHYPRIFAWMEEIKTKAKEIGYVETLYGLKRYIPEIQDKNKTVMKSGERIAVNTIVQGTAAEIMKKSMSSVYYYLQQEKIGKIVLQLHDEILVEIPEDKQEKAKKDIIQIMESVVNWSISLKVNTKINTYWH